MYCPNPSCPDLAATGRPGEYLDTVTVCPVCGEYLVSEPPTFPDDAAQGTPGEPAHLRPDPGARLEAVFETSDPTEVPIVESLLTAESVPFVIRGQEKLAAFHGGGTAFRFNPLAGRVTFMVAAEDAEAARALLRELDSGE